LLHNNLNNNVL